MRQYAINMPSFFFPWDKHGLQCKKRGWYSLIQIHFLIYNSFVFLSDFPFCINWKWKEWKIHFQIFKFFKLKFKKEWRIAQPFYLNWYHVMYCLVWYFWMNIFDANHGKRLISKKPYFKQKASYEIRVQKHQTLFYY